MRSAFLALAMLAGLTTAASAELRVAATFTIVADMVRQIGGDHVSVTALVGANGDAHGYRPTPRDAETLAAADVLVVNGLGFDGWITRLARAASFDGRLVVASGGVSPGSEEHTHDHDGTGEDPHLWHDPMQARAYVARIAEGLATADPEHAADYAARASAYTDRIIAVDTEIRALVATIPPEQRRLVTAHDAFGHFGRAYRIEMLAVQGINPDARPSAQDLARLIRTIRESGATALFFESGASTRALAQVADETGVAIGGTLYADALSEPDGPAPSYLAMLRHNARTIAEALATR